LDKRRPNSVVLILFFVSGVAGLVFEVTWAKYLALFLGNTAHAHILVLAVFMGGLSLGNYLFGRIADGKVHRLRLYGLLELFVSLAGFTYPWYFVLLSSLYLRLATSSAAEGGGWLVAVAKVGLCIASVLPATVAMGGTFPLLARLCSTSMKDVPRALGHLYFANTLGAALGALTAGFVLIPLLGLDSSVYAASSTLLVVGAIAVSLSPAFQDHVAAVSPTGEVRALPLAQEARPEGAPLSLIVSLAGLSGAVNMLYEVAWTRALTLFLGSSTYSFSLMLTSFLAGIALGGIAYVSLAARWQRPLGIFAGAQLATGLVLVLSIPLYQRIPYYYSVAIHLVSDEQLGFLAYQLVIFALGTLVMIVPAVLMGITLPAMSAASAGAVESLGTSVGTVFAYNTLGTILGTVAGGLFLIPELGLEKTFVVGTALTMGIGVLALASVRSVRALPAVPLTVACVCAFLILSLLMRSPWDPRVLAKGEFRNPSVGFDSFDAYRESLDDQVLYHRDGVNTTVTVLRDGDSIYLKVNGKTDASTKGDLSTQLLLGHLPALLHTGARNAAVIGFGSGITAGALTLHGLASIDIFEIAQEVIEASEIFAPYNHNVMANPSVRVHVRDAREAFMVSGKKYDIIVSEPSNPWMAGVSSLFTREFFEATYGSLADHGVMLQWFHDYAMTDDLALLILKTIREVFPKVTVWGVSQSDIFIAAFKDVDGAPDYQAMEARVRDPQIAADLRSVYIRDLYGLLALQLLSPNKVDGLLADVSRINTDRMPILEYAAPKAFFEDRSSAVLRSNDEKGRSPWVSDLFLSGYVILRPADVSSLEGIWEHQKNESSHGEAFMLSVLEAWARQDPNDPRPVLELVRRYYHRGDYGTAEARVQWLIERDPGSPILLGLLAEVWEAEARRSTSALAAPGTERRRGLLNRLLKAAPDKADLSMKLGRLEMEAGQWWDAIGHLTAAMVALERERPADESAREGIGEDLALCYRKAVETARDAVARGRTP
jgi:spermidine synthase